jgi:hypothetical protein
MIEIPLTDADWSRVAYLFPMHPVAGRGRPRSHPRALLNGILWVLINRQKWRCLPATFPPQQTCYNRWLQWKNTGVMEVVSVELGLDAITADTPEDRKDSIEESRTSRSPAYFPASLVAF